MKKFRNERDTFIKEALSDINKHTDKTPIYKQWAFWFIVFGILIGIIYITIHGYNPLDWEVDYSH